MTKDMGTEVVRRVAVLGGTGRMGAGLALRLAAAGVDVRIGSRSPARAEAVAAELSRCGAPAGRIRGVCHVEAVRDADVVVLAVRADRCAPLAADLRALLAGRVVLSCANPLSGHRDARPVGAWPSIAELVQRAAPEARVAGALHHLAATRLADLDDRLDDCDVLVCSDDLSAAAVATELAVAVTGRRGVPVGPLHTARLLEAFTEVLLGAGRALGTLPGLRVTPSDPSPSAGLAPAVRAVAL